MQVSNFGGAFDKGVLCTVKKGGRKGAVSAQCEVRLKMAAAEPA